MRLLVIEDNRDIAANLGDYLEDRGHTVDYAADGVTGLHLAVVNDFDAIVLDLNLPGIDGIEVCRKLRMEGRKQTPVLMLTARDSLESKLAGFESGADDYLTKPFAATELLARVRALGRRGEMSASGEAEREIVPGLLLDEGRHALTAGEKVIDLSAREYALIAYLIRNRGIALTRQQLLDEVWGAEPDVYSNVVDLYVHYLRKKFEEAGFNDLLKTVRGVGYRLADAPKAK